MSKLLVGCLLFPLVVSGCGTKPTTPTPSQAVQRDVAGRFSTALLRGDVEGARGLLAPRKDEALELLVQDAVAPWRGRRVSIQLPPRRAGEYWAVGFARRRTQRDKTFETQRGDLLVTVALSAIGPRVTFFTFENLVTRYSTHRDSQLLPSKR